MEVEALICRNRAGDRGRYGFTVHLFECGQGDHVHCFCVSPPKLSNCDRGNTRGYRQETFERFPEIRT